MREIVVVAHSAGGLVAAHAVGQLPPPARKLTLVTIGAPFAGMHICPWSEVDVLHAPLMLSVAAVYHNIRRRRRAWRSSNTSPPIPPIR